MIKKQKTPIIDVKKYGGKQVAIVNGRIIASGEKTKDVLDKAMRVVPGTSWHDVLLVSVPKGVTVVYRF